MHTIEIKKKKLKGVQTVGDLFEQQRVQRDISLQDLSAILKISPLYLQALEHSQYDQLPCLIYTRNFVKCYAEWLNLDVCAVVALFEKEYALFERVSKPVECEKKEAIKRSDFWRLPKWISIFCSSLAVIAILSYFGFELYKLRRPPLLIVDSPAEEMIIDKQLVEILGQSDPEGVLSINNQTVLSDSKGYFKEQVALQPGLNIIEIKAQKKHSDPAIVYRKIMVQESPQFTKTEETSG